MQLSAAGQRHKKQNFILWGRFFADGFCPLTPSSEAVPALWRTGGAGAEIAVDDDDIITDIFNIAPFDDDILLPSQQSEKTETAIDNESHYAGILGIDI
jgi:hypothetical protein